MFPADVVLGSSKQFVKDVIVTLNAVTLSVSAAFVTASLAMF
jgi:hypothetical protein